MGKSIGLVRMLGKENTTFSHLPPTAVLQGQKAYFSQSYFQDCDVHRLQPLRFARPPNQINSIFSGFSCSHSLRTPLLNTGTSNSVPDNGEPNSRLSAELLAAEYRLRRNDGI